LKSLKTVLWLSNDIFAVGDHENKTEDPQSYMVYRASNGRVFCRFYLRTEYEFLKSTTVPNLHATNVTGILDKRTNKIYDTSFLSLIHLGARRFNLRPKPLWEDESKKIPKEKEIMVLGQLAPALFFNSLVELETHNADLNMQNEIIQFRIFRYTLI
jgi:hypothetical protein